jgi:pyruvate dehydrogenase E1 component
MDEPESLGAITLAAREGLDNLIFVINCNLQRLDGPVRGNGKIIQELEAVFRGAGWNVIKVIWGDDWDPLLARTPTAAASKRWRKCVDGDYQKYSSWAAPTSASTSSAYPSWQRMVENLTDEASGSCAAAGTTPRRSTPPTAAVTDRGPPTVILAKTIKGYGMGEAGEGQNITHQQKKINEEELRLPRPLRHPHLRRQIHDAPFYRPRQDSPEVAI